MNSYSLGISGSWALAILLVLVLVAFSFYTYRYTVPPVSRGWRIFLATLRSLALGILMFILFEPVFTRVTGKASAPKVAVYIDNSISAGEKDAKLDRRAEMRNAIEKSGLTRQDKDFMKTYLFDNDVFEVVNFDYNSLKFSGQSTDLSKPLRHLLPSDDNNVRAGILITDGAFNVGNNPLYDVSVLDKPLYIIGIGDSMPAKDVILQSIVTNEIAYVDNVVPVMVNVKTSGFMSGELAVKLQENGHDLETKTVSISSEDQSFSLNFDYKPSHEGDQKLSAVVAPIAGEITKKNNKNSEYIKVLKNKRKIAIFAGSPSPDVSFLRNALKDEKNLELQMYVQKKGAAYYDKEPNRNDLHETEMYFLIGFPNASTSEATLAMLKTEFATGKPVFFLSSSAVNANKLSQLEEYLPFKTSSLNGRNEFAAVADFRREASAHSILRVTGGDADLDMWNTLPPLYRFEHYVTVKPESERIANVKLGNTTLQDPMILSRVFRNQKSVAVLASGLYRWKLMGFAGALSRENNEVYDLYDIFIKNSMRWLSVDQNNKSVTIKTTKRKYTTDEKVGFVAQVYDAAYNPIDDAKVSVDIRGAKGKRNVILSAMGSGRYYVEVEGFAEGDYSFSGKATLGDTPLGDDSGRFSVGEIALEYLNFSMNAPLLRDMALRSGGKFYPSPDQCGSIFYDIRKHKTFRDRSITIRNEYALWNLVRMLVAVILLLAVEWTIRKRLGMI